MSIYYKYAPDVSKIVILSYVDDCVYCYNNEVTGKWFVDTLGKNAMWTSWDMHIGSCQ